MRTFVTESRVRLARPSLQFPCRFGYLVSMPMKSDLQDRLARYRQIKIDVTGKNSGKAGRREVLSSARARLGTSGTRTCSHRFGLMREAWARSLEPSP